MRILFDMVKGLYLSQSEWAALHYDDVGNGALALSEDMIKDLLNGMSEDQLASIRTTPDRVRAFISSGDLRSMLEKYLYMTSSTARRSWPR